MYGAKENEITLSAVVENSYYDLLTQQLKKIIK